MLKELRIRNLALIESAELQFGAGLTVITGETGAGKSVFLTALRLLGGEKFSKNSVRRGCDSAVVEGIFDLSNQPALLQLASEEEIELFDHELVIERVMTAAGKIRNRINGSIVSQTLIQKVGGALIQSHGQSEQLLLRDLRSHAVQIDLYGGHTELLELYRTALRATEKAKTALEQLKKEQSELAAQEEFLRYQRDELEKAKLKEGEEEELTALLNRVNNSGEQTRLVEQATALLKQGGQSLAGELQQLSRQIERLAELLPQFEGYSSPLIDAQIQVQELEEELERWSGQTTQLSEYEIDRHNSRLALLQKLQRKYHTDLPGLIQLLQRRNQELAGLSNAEIDLADAEEQLRLQQQQLHSAAIALHTARKQAATSLQSQVEAELQQLGMADARLITHFAPINQELQYGADGADHPEFYAAINPGEGERPLRNTLSGGELSRLMLALKSTLAQSDTTPLLIFDEVEAGISGETGHRVGERLAALGQHHQVLTVSHLHQIAARATHHLQISKEVEDGRTRTSVVSLNFQQRIGELARMLGASDDHQTRDHAQTLLKQLAPLSEHSSP